MENTNDNFNENLDDMPELKPNPEPSYTNSKKGNQVFYILTAIFIFTFLFIIILKGGEYGYTLFFTIPFTLSFIISYNESANSKGTALKAFGKAIGLISIVSLLLVAAKLEGFICVLMAIGFLVLPAFLGSFLGYFLSHYFRELKFSMLMTVFLINPFTLTYDVYDETKIDSIAEISVPIAASDTAVWLILTQKVSFKKPDNIFLQSGVAYPFNMEVIETEGKKYLFCQTNMGSNIFKVDSLIEGRKMQFSTTQELIPMKELTPYDSLDVAHLHGYFDSDYGIFEIKKIDDNNCILTAKTHYTYEITPRFYWEMWSDYLINSMHKNVLYTIKEKAEKNEQ